MFPLHYQLAVAHQQCQATVPWQYLATGARATACMYQIAFAAQPGGLPRLRKEFSVRDTSANSPPDLSGSEEPTLTMMAGGLHPAACSGTLSRSHLRCQVRRLCCARAFVLIPKNHPEHPTRIRSTHTLSVDAAHAGNPLPSRRTLPLPKNPRKEVSEETAWLAGLRTTAASRRLPPNSQTLGVCLGCLHAGTLRRPGFGWLDCVKDLWEKLEPPKLWS